MKPIVMSKVKNHLSKREEVEFTIDSDKNPSIVDVEKIVADHFSSTIENIKVRQIKGKFGSKTFYVKADIYENADQKTKYGMIKKRNKKKKVTKAKGGRK